MEESDVFEGEIRDFERGESRSKHLHPLAVLYID